MRGGRSGGRGSGGGRHSGTSGGGYRNPCLTMHQPWASLLVAGIKRVEGRSWPSPVTGRLWIHAAGKVPDPDTVAAMEAFYREIHAVDGVAGIEFPQHYPVSRLLGCVEVVGCVRSEELVCWEDVPESVRLEGLTDFCWLCENPQKLVVPFEMRGYQGVYNLERKGHSIVDDPFFRMPWKNAEYKHVSDVKMSCKHLRSDFFDLYMMFRLPFSS